MSQTLRWSQRRLRRAVRAWRSSGTSSAVHVLLIGVAQLWIVRLRCHIMRRALLIIVCVVILIGAALGFLRWGLLRHFGPVYDIRKSQDVEKLLAIAEGSRPLREALERFKHDHGTYPETITNLFPSYLQAAPTMGDRFRWAGWDYMEQSTNSYSLYYQTDWDDHLVYDHPVQGTDQWYYAGTTGETDLTQKFQQR